MMPAAAPARTAKPKKPKGDVWTAQDVAAYLRCSDRHVTNLAKRGVIAGKQFGNIWRFRRQDVVEFR